MSRNWTPCTRPWRRDATGASAAERGRRGPPPACARALIPKFSTRPRPSFPPLRSADKYRALVQEASKAQGNAMGKYAVQRKELSRLSSRLKELTKKAAKAAAATAGPSLLPADARARLDEAREILDDIDAVRPSTGSIFVRLFLGQVNVKAATREDR